MTTEAAPAPQPAAAAAPAAPAAPATATEPASTPAAAPAIAEAVEAAPQDEGKKVFVGNLAFKTSEESLRQIFEGQGTITDATVITRRYSKGARSLGYAFVTFATESEAQAAVSAMDKKEIEGRQINVEMAKPMAQTERGNIAKEAAKAANNGQVVPAAAEGVAGRGRSGRRGRGRGRGRSGRGRSRSSRRAAPADGEADAAPAAAIEGSQETHKNGTVAEGESAAQGEEGAARGKGRRGRGRGRAARRGPPEGEPSKTLLFVANLPFSVDNDRLKAVFDGYKVKSAHVVTRKRGPVTGLSKGFGFVDLEDEAEQKKVLEAFNGKEVDGREIQVKVAVESSEPLQAPESADPSGPAAPEAVPPVPSLSA